MKSHHPGFPATRPEAPAIRPRLNAAANLAGGFLFDNGRVHGLLCPEPASHLISVEVDRKYRRCLEQQEYRTGFKKAVTATNGIYCHISTSSVRVRH